MTRVELPTVSLCAGCGNCCRHIGLPPFEVANPDLVTRTLVPAGDLSAAFVRQLLADTDTFARMPAALRAEHARLVLGLKADPTGEPCAWLDAETGACKHYEYRPAVCRDFVPGSPPCESLRTAEVKCVWTEPAPVEMWQNPRCPDRFASDPTKYLPRWGRWLVRLFAPVGRIGWFAARRNEYRRAIVVHALPRYLVYVFWARNRLTARAVRRARLRATACDDKRQSPPGGCACVLAVT